MMAKEKVPITSYGQLKEYFLNGSKPKENWSIGLECEVLGVHNKTFKPITYYEEGGVFDILRYFIEQFDWNPVFEGDAIIALTKGKASITLEPSGQLELSGSPCSSISQCIEEFDNFIFSLKQAVQGRDISFLGVGYNPFATLDNTQWIPKSRYEIMSEYFNRHGGELAHHMMKLTATDQVCIDYSGEEDFIKKFKISSYLTPFVRAMFANSPLKNLAYWGYLDFRGKCWEHTDNARCGLIEVAFSPHFSIASYVDFLLDMPMILRKEGEEYIPMEGMIFRDYLETGKATMADWDLHTSFAFTEVRAKTFLELRMCDAQNRQLLPAIPALWKGILYDKTAQEEVLAKCEGWKGTEIIALNSEVNRSGLKGEFNGRKIIDICRELYEIAYRGLERLKRQENLHGEEKLLLPLYELLFLRGICPAEEMLQLFDQWGRDKEKLREFLSY